MNINLKIAISRIVPGTGAEAVLLLKVILRFFEAVSALPGGEGAQARSKAERGWENPMGSIGILWESYGM